METKLCDTMLVEGNVFQGYPTGLLFRIANQAGKAPWSTIKNVTIRNNLFTSFSYALSIALQNDWYPATDGKDIFIYNNLAYGGGSQAEFGDASRFLSPLGDGDNVQIYHNTVIGELNGQVVSGGAPTTNFAFRDNIATYGLYGLRCSVGNNASENCWPRGVISKNVSYKQQRPR